MIAIPVRNNKIVHNHAAVTGTGLFVLGFGMGDWRALYGVGPISMTGNQIGFNDFRGSTSEIAALPGALLDPQYNSLVGNLGKNRSDVSDNVPANTFKPVID